MLLALKAPWNERNGRFSAVKLVVFIALFAPAVWILFQLSQGWLFPKPVIELTHRTGDWAARLIMLSLLISPLRKMAQWPKAIILRRMVGVAAFAYALAHFSLYIIDQSFDLLHVASEIALRFYLTIGFVTLLGLGALAATSTDAMIKRLGAQKWNRLHNLVYAIAALGLLHYYIQAKKDVTQPVLLSGLYFLLMLYRLFLKRGAPLWAAVVGAAALAPVISALAEAGWYALVRHIDFWEVLSANFDPELDFSASFYVAMVGIVFVAVYGVRNFKLPGLAALAGAK